ncbi:alpha/beta family hydrolase [Leifsonia soli]|uniref:KANL3/Tex30 alpha/beta hydrolase-like domain-containing protein n=1 Tax=Leifsonia soli TaxID=582665 RepID=A0A852T010_9MICO|nr:alpha/beta family hydrolase [Leifsonia soli]NYD73990.1 hypothetical protein [Leifsonia soli]
MQIDVPTTVGPGRLTVSPAEDPAAVLWLGHGAGGGIDAVDLGALAARLPAERITVVRYEQPWRVAGKRVAARPATLDVAWEETAPRVRELAGDLPLVVGGRSAGARVACRTAAALDARAVVCLAFPLHPPGTPERSRLDELLAPVVPVLVVQGGSDPFGSASVIAAEVGAAEVGAAEVGAAEVGAAEVGASGPGASGRIRVVEVPGADHGMRVPKASVIGAAGVRDLIVSTVAEFVRAVV